MRPVIILSTPRSGSSIVAGVVHYLGVDLGKYYLKPDTHNPTGNFEDAQLYEIDFKYYEKDRERWYAETRKYLKERLKLRIPWGWKSPLLSVTLKDVKAIFSDFTLKPRYIYVQRDLRGIVKSQQKHFAKKDVHGKIKVHQALLREGLKGEEVLDVHFSEVMGNPPKVVTDIIKYLELEPTPDQKLRAMLSVIQSPLTEGSPVLAVPSRLYK